MNGHFQVENYPNIFAGGDVADVGRDELKLAQTAEMHGEIIACNILRHHEQACGYNSRLLSYTPKDRILDISLGEFDGLLVYWGFCLSGFIPAIIKECVEWKTMCRYWKPVLPTLSFPSLSWRVKKESIRSELADIKVL